MIARALGLGCLLAVAVPAAASAHSLVRPADGLIAYLSQDATSLNSLTVSSAGGRISFRDPTVDGGMDPGSCSPGEVSARDGYIVQASCPATGVRRVRVDLGEREDTARVTASVAATLLGGAGADALTGGGLGDQLAGGTGDDRLAGGAGDDVLDGGLGADTLTAGDGNDELRTRDGIADEISCGGGRDTVVADTLDIVAGDCERVDTVSVAPPPGAQELRADKVAPQVRAASPRTQRVAGSRRTFRVVASTSEVGAVAASGVLDVAGRALPVVAVRRVVTVGGAGVELRLAMSRGQQRAVVAALRSGRRVRLALSVVGTDRAGNSREVELPVIRLVP